MLKPSTVYLNSSARWFPGSRFSSTRLRKRAHSFIEIVQRTPFCGGQSAMSSTSTDSRRIKIAVVGDVHYLWIPNREKLALDHLKPDLVLFVGDFGEEEVELVKKIYALDYPKLIILGNHDAWYASYSPKSEILSSAAKEQLDLLGEIHIGYSLKEFPNLGVSVCGGRPFSWGGSEWIHTSKLFSELFGVNNTTESASKIVEACKNVSKDHLLILMGHNGPKGLGDSPESICGKDWRKRNEPVGGDFGDADLQLAIEMLRNENIHPSLVIFGHMHHLTKTKKQRIMLEKDDHGTFYVNSAVVPRIRKGNAFHGKASNSHQRRDDPDDDDDDDDDEYDDDQENTDHHFVLIELEGKSVMEIYDVWVNVREESGVVTEAERWNRFVNSSQSFV